MFRRVPESIAALSLALCLGGLAWACPGNIPRAVIYPVAVIKGSKNPTAAKQFAAFLLSSEAGAIFQKYGFHLAGP